MQATLNADDGASTLALKPMVGVNRSPKKRAPTAPQNGVCHRKIEKKYMVYQRDTNLCMMF